MKEFRFEKIDYQSFWYLDEDEKATLCASVIKQLFGIPTDSTHMTIKVSLTPIENWIAVSIERINIDEDTFISINGEHHFLSDAAAFFIKEFGDNFPMNLWVKVEEI